MIKLSIDRTARSAIKITDFGTKQGSMVMPNGATSPFAGLSGVCWGTLLIVSLCNISPAGKVPYEFNTDVCNPIGKGHRETL